MSSHYIDIIKKRENSKKLSFEKSGWNSVKKRWYPHTSLEGGFKTIAYGHKLDKSGYFTIGGERFNARDGITDKQASQLVKKDFAIARKSALAHAKKGGLDHIEGLVDATASLIMNVRAESWGKSRALKALEFGDYETYIAEAFGKEGFNKMANPDTSEHWAVSDLIFSKGLAARRAAERAEIKPKNSEIPKRTLEQDIKPIKFLEERNDFLKRLFQWEGDS